MADFNSNVNSFKRILAVGDIHGMYIKLKMLMEQVCFNPKDDILIYVGDYIDRGLQSLACLDYVIDLQQRYPERVICLKGNHEAMCLDYYAQEGRSRGYMSDSTDTIMIWLENGGYETYQQFRQLEKSELQERLRWMRALPNHYQIGNYYFCHAGVEPHVPLKKQKEEDLLWIRKWFIKMYHGKETIIVGHTPVQIIFKSLEHNPEPQFLNNNIILCDTGSGTFTYGGRLSCVDVLSRQFWQI